MATESKPASNAEAAAAKNKKRKRYLPHNKPVKKKGSYPLHPGIQGFFITCDGGREQQASREALNVIDSFYDELVLGEDSSVKVTSNKPLNTKITFSDSDSSSSDDNDESEEEDEEVEEQEAEEEKGDKKLKSDISNDGNGANGESDPRKIKDVHVQAVGKVDNKGDIDNCESQGKTTDEPLVEKQHCKINVPTCDSKDKEEPKSIDRLIEAEIQELGDKNKRRFVKLDSGCNGVVFIQMRKKGGEIGPKDIAQHMVTSLASTRKHMSRFLLRILPIEVSCYASEEEISKAVKPLVERYFPVETQNPQKFAVLYEARANSGIDRMKVIDAIAKSVPGPHKVDLNHPDKTIVVEIVKTVCLIGVIEKYKELSKYNIRQLTSPKA